MFVALRVIVFLLSGLLCVVAAGAGGSARPPQVILISFDGAQAIEQWERSRALSRRTGARFTYFVSCTYLIGPEVRQRYRGPRTAAGKSNVGFAHSRDDVAGRLRQVWAARREGHEIASHGCGHFDGGKWAEAEWLAEHAAFASFMKDAWTLNRIPFEPRGWKRFAETEIRGFRAPYLSTGKPMFKALKKAGFHYDASGVSRGPERPRAKNGLYRFALPTIPEGPRGRRIIAMDYNLYVRHSGGLEAPSKAAEFSNRAYQAFMAAFEREHSGARRPLSLGFHFTLMNEGAYWDALEQFAGEVCTRPDVDCITYRDHLGRIDGEQIGG